MYVSYSTESAFMVFNSINFLPRCITMSNLILISHLSRVNFTFLLYCVLPRYMNSRPRFMEGYDVHFLCEYTGHWHLTGASGPDDCAAGIQMRLGSGATSSDMTGVRLQTSHPQQQQLNYHQQRAWISSMAPNVDSQNQV